LIRVLIIGTFSVGGDRLFSQAEGRAGFRPASFNQKTVHPSTNIPQKRQPQPVVSSFRAAPKPNRPDNGFSRPEPSYHNISMSTSSGREGSYIEPRK